MPDDVYYNEADPYAAQFLRNLIAAGELPAGVVDERDIRDVQPSNLDGFAQCHFFAGVGIWAKALQIAGWRDTQPVWTGSCPCQPLSAAGKGLGFDDERHLWPDWHWLIQQCRPETIFGEQVASADGLKWADLVQADLEATDYAFGPVDTCAAGFGGYHIRQRLYFASIDTRLANAACQPGRLSNGRQWQQMLEAIWCSAIGGMEYGKRTGLERHAGHVGAGTEPGRNETRPHRPAAKASAAGGLDHPVSNGREPGRNGDHATDDRQQPDAVDADGILADTTNARRLGNTPSARPLPTPFGGIHRTEEGAGARHAKPERSGNAAGSGAPDIYGAAADWLFCRDGKWRPVEPGTFPLADAHSGRVGELRAYGNALDLGQATAFVHAFMERPLDLGNTVPGGDLFEWAAT